MYFEYSTFRGRRLCFKLIPIFQKLSKTKLRNDPVLYSLYTLTCWSPNPSTSECDSVWNRVFKEVIKVKWGHLWASMTFINKRKYRYRYVYDQRKDQVRPQQEGSHLCKPRRGASEETKPSDTLSLGLQPPEILILFEKITICCLSHLVCYFVMVALAKYYNIQYLKRVVGSVILIFRTWK